MANLQAILAYQEIDRKMFALEKEVSDSAERKAYIRLKKYLEGASEKLDTLEAKAAGLKTEAVQRMPKAPPCLSPVISRSMLSGHLSHTAFLSPPPPPRAAR